MKSLFTTLLFLISCTGVFAQDEAKPADTVKKGLSARIKASIEKSSKRKEAKIAEGKMVISPFAMPGYTPEAGFLFSVGALFTFTTDKKDTSTQRSSIPVVGGITGRGGYWFSAPVTTFWLKDRLRITSDQYFKRMPDHYFGVGYTSGDTTKMTDSTKYVKTTWGFKPKVAWRFFDNLFVGVSFDFNQTIATDLTHQIERDPYIQKYGTNIFNAGMGLFLRYDSRDIVVCPWNGLYAEVLANFYGPYLGGDYTYEIFQADVRYYQTIAREGSVLAMTISGRFGADNVPWSDMGSLGSSYDLRGYYLGQYRDRSSMFIIAEYRNTIRKRGSDELSPHGIVTWIGAGSVGYDPSQFNDWLPSIGIGYRLALQPRMNMRIDFGIGKNSSGLYFNFTEAF